MVREEVVPLAESQVADVVEDADLGMVASHPVDAAVVRTIDVEHLEVRTGTEGASQTSVQEALASIAHDQHAEFRR